MTRKKRMIRKQKKKKTPHWKGTSKYARKQAQKRERAAREIGLPVSSSWAEINEARKKKIKAETEGDYLELKATNEKEDYLNEEK